MAGIRHFTASAIVFDDHERALLVHHNKLGRWLYPGGHIDPDEDPAQAAQREVVEETGVRTQVMRPAPRPALAPRSVPCGVRNAGRAIAVGGRADRPPPGDAQGQDDA
ncbi:NUDIX hydrolase [Planosporangium sp. 12N6]|uniref:NUDIX hydrolase n=1 Tax=Planosporangium spinosum TaxID=3402278 RepID=UPI003CE6B848